MSKISCDAVKCVFNTHGGCSRTSIEVEGNCDAHKCDATYCDSFSDKIGELRYCACTNGCACDSSNIACEVTNCAYNKGEFCTADHIHVGNSSACKAKETECDTFVEKNG